MIGFKPKVVGLHLLCEKIVGQSAKQLMLLEKMKMEGERWTMDHKLKHFDSSRFVYHNQYRLIGIFVLQVKMTNGL